VAYISDEREIPKIAREASPAVVVAVGPDAAGLVLSHFPRKPLLITYVPDEERYLQGSGEHTRIVFSLLADPCEFFFSLSTLVPGVQRLGVIYSQNFPSAFRKRAAEAAQANGVELVDYEASGPKDVFRLLPALFREVDAFWLLLSPALYPKPVQDYLLEKAYKQKIAVFSHTARAARSGALFSLSTDNQALGRQLAEAAREIMTGQAPEGPEVRFHSSPIFTVNLTILRRLGLSESVAAKLKAERYERF
jgi:ABC-type uncharacterized transport system substrate-binding protein